MLYIMPRKEALCRSPDYGRALWTSSLRIAGDNVNQRGRCRQSHSEQLTSWAITVFGTQECLLMVCMVGWVTSKDPGALPNYRPRTLDLVFR